MDAGTYWVIVLAIAAPVSGVVGFAIQLRRLRTSRLENEKLQLEIEALREELRSAERRIVQPTNDEVLKYTLHREAMFSRGGGRGSEPAYRRQWIKDVITDTTMALVILLVVAYLIYDLYRLVTWMISKF